MYKWTNKFSENVALLWFWKMYRGNYEDIRFKVIDRSRTCVSSNAFRHKVPVVSSDVDKCLVEDLNWLFFINNSPLRGFNSNQIISLGIALKTDYNWHGEYANIIVHKYATVTKYL